MLIILLTVCCTVNHCNEHIVSIPSQETGAKHSTKRQDSSRDVNRAVPSFYTVQFWKFSPRPGRIA